MSFDLVYAVLAVSIHADDRMDSEMNGVTELVKDHPDGVNEESHIRRDDLYHRMFTDPPVVFDRRVERTDLNLARFSFFC